VALVVGVLSQAQGPPSTKNLDDELKDRVLAFVSRTTSAPVFQIAIEPVDRSGLRKVTARLGEAEDAPSRVYYVTQDASRIIEGDLRELNPDPWRSARGQLEALARKSPSRGNPSAPVLLVEFSDFQCPFCAEFSREVDALEDEMPRTLRVVFEQFPLAKIHPWAQKAARVADCVARQGDQAFWAFERTAFERQKEVDAERPEMQIRQFAREANVNLERLDQCLADPSSLSEVEASLAGGSSVGVSGTPTVFLNGRRIPGAISIETLRSLIKTEAALTERYK
jgi:protein-disulfide isomerase